MCRGNVLSLWSDAVAFVLSWKDMYQAPELWSDAVALVLS